VVGSGYGGAVAAARLAIAGRSVCVLERGRELRPGAYPASFVAALRNLQLDVPPQSLFSPTALFDLRLNGDLKVLVGCGLGGTSLINANVVLAPDDDLFTKEPWPERIRKEARRGALKRHFARAEETLNPSEFPFDQYPRKYRALERIVDKLGRPTFDIGLARVAVTFPKHDADVGFRRNPFGAMQHPCTGCGDCVSGCNFAAKNTVLMNYLPWARNHGAAIFTEMKVTSVARDAARRGWVLHCELLGAGRRRFDAPALTIAADTVILAAGSLGSTEILLRSRDAGLLLSEQLGYKFSGNGDVLAFAYNGRELINGVGAGRRSFHGTEAPGPCITGIVRRAHDPPIVMQEGVIPGALAPILSVGFLLARMLKGRDAALTGRRRSLWRLVDDYFRGGTAATQTFLAMLKDTAQGQLDLVDGRMKVIWPGAGRGAEYDEFVGLVERACAAVDAAYVPSPFGAITVHPLGGCPMADDIADGVVNDVGAVFDPTRERGDVYPGLYVCDASTIPCALGANPLLTITALAERSAAAIAARRA
jgi:cholesterol oxidase